MNWNIAELVHPDPHRFDAPPGYHRTTAPIICAAAPWPGAPEMELSAVVEIEGDCWSVTDLRWFPHLSDVAEEFDWRDRLQTAVKAALISALEKDERFARQVADADPEGELGR